MQTRMKGGTMSQNQYQASKMEGESSPWQCQQQNTNKIEEAALTGEEIEPRKDNQERCKQQSTGYAKDIPKIREYEEWSEEKGNIERENRDEEWLGQDQYERWTEERDDKETEYSKEEWLEQDQQDQKYENNKKLAQQQWRQEGKENQTTEEYEPKKGKGYAGQATTRWPQQKGTQHNNKQWEEITVEDPWQSNDPWTKAAERLPGKGPDSQTKREGRQQ